jgi:hypothetical protein
MLITRRGFFGLFGAASATAIVAPKTYVFAPRGGWFDPKYDVLDINKWRPEPMVDAVDAVDAIELEAFAAQLPDLISFTSMRMMRLMGRQICRG